MGMYAMTLRILESLLKHPECGRILDSVMLSEVMQNWWQLGFPIELFASPWDLKLLCVACHFVHKDGSLDGPYSRVSAACVHKQ